MIITIGVTDDNNPNKVHTFTTYKCGHVFYNQEISGHRMYARSVRINKSHPYYSYLARAKAEAVDGAGEIVSAHSTVTGYAAVTKSGVTIAANRRAGVRFKSDVRMVGEVIYGTKRLAA